MPLINYQLNETNANSFAHSMQHIVPKLLRRLYLVNNALKDKDLAEIMRGIAKTRGLERITVIGNGLGQQTYDSIAEELIPSRGFQQTKQLILKDPNPIRVAPKSLMKVFKSLEQHSAAFRLRTLVLSKLGMDKASVEALGKAIQELDYLEQLDISANALQGQQLIAFFEALSGKNDLRSLNIAYNSGQMKRTTNKTDNVNTSPAFVDVLCDFLHSSASL